MILALGAVMGTLDCCCYPINHKGVTVASDWNKHGQDGACSHAALTTNYLLGASHHTSPPGLFFPLFCVTSI